MVVLKKRPLLLPMGIGELLRGVVVLCIKLGDFRGVVLNNLWGKSNKYTEIGVK